MNLCYISGLPIILIKHILNFTDTITTIKFSMTCSTYLKKLYPDRMNTNKLISKLFKIKNIRIYKLKNNNIDLCYRGGYDQCNICDITDGNEDAYKKCRSCGKQCCNSCKGKKRSENIYCLHCYSCSKCNTVNKSENNLCKICDSSHCKKCSIGGYECKLKGHFVCKNCIDVLYYCKLCYNKCCECDVYKYGIICKSCRNK